MTDFDPNAELAGTAPATDTPTPTPAPADGNTLVFAIPNTEPETQMSVALGDIPAELRMEFLKKAVQQYIVNSTNQVVVRHTKDTAGWTDYDEATKADPLQTAVAKPEGERPAGPQDKIIEAAKAARDRLYKGEVRRQGTGEKKARKAADPLDALVTRSVVTELFEKNKGTIKGYKYVDATKAVADAGGGIAYLDAKIAERVAAGADASALQKFKENRYINPAKLMLGQRDTAGTKDQSLL